MRISKFIKYTVLTMGVVGISSNVFASDLKFVNPYDINNYKRIINFSGYEFKVKDSSISQSGRLGPNNNVFSDSTNNVSIDSSGRLILKLTNENGINNAAEVISKDDFGYGRYIFKIASRIDRIDKNITFSAFLYKDDNNEIDIEFSNFGKYNSQFIVQPYYKENHMSTYISKLNGTYTSYVVDYTKNYIKFDAYHGHNIENKRNLINSWTYSGKDMPNPENMKLRFNLYIRGNEFNINKYCEKVIIKEIKYIKI